MITTKLAIRHINRRAIQSALFILGVALGVAVIIAIDIANSSAKRAFALSTESITGKTTHQIVGGPNGIPTELYTQIRTELGIGTSAPVIFDYVQGIGDQPLRLLGVDPFAEPPFRNYLSTGDNTLSFDAFNTFLTQPDTAIISQSLADRNDISQGDVVAIQANQSTVDITIIGLIQPGDNLSEQALDDLILTDISTAQDIVGQPDFITRIDLILPDSQPLFASIDSLLPDGVRLIDANDGDTTLAQMTAAFELNLQALSLLALIVGVFLIYNTVTFSVIQRRPIIGIMRSVGATRPQIFRMILGEALILGVMGTILGLGVGIIFGRGAVKLVSETINNLYFTVNVQRINVELFTLIKGATVGIIASIITAVPPAISATRTPPAGVMRRSDYERNTRRYIPYITAIGLMMNIVGLILLQIPTRSIEISFAALFMMIIGGALFVPVALMFIMQIATPITGRLFGIVGRMAPRAVNRSLSRTSVAVAALTVAVSVIVGVSAMIASFRSTVDDWLQATLGSDIYISAPSSTATVSTADLDPELLTIVANIDGVIKTDSTRSAFVTSPDYPDFAPVVLQSVDSDNSNGNRKFAEIIVDDYLAAMDEGAVVITEPFAFRRELSAGDSITLFTDKGEQTFPIVGVYYDYTTDQGKVLMSYKTYRTYYNDPYITALAADIAPDADLNTVIADIQTALGDYNLIVQANRELRSGVFEVFDNAFAITIALRLLATIVAFIGILSALLSLQLENTKQYAVMRANGMTPFQLWKFTLIQTLLMGIVAGIMAIPIGLVLALVLIFVINVRSFGWTMDFYLIPREFIEAFMVAVVGALLAGIYPAWRLTRLVIAQALRYE